MQAVALDNVRFPLKPDIPSVLQAAGYGMGAWMIRAAFSICDNPRGLSSRGRARASAAFAAFGRLSA